MTRHFLTGSELAPSDLEALLERALVLKAAPLSSQALAGRHVALVFDRPSTRTRLSFEAGVVELGGHPLILRGDELQLTRGESLRDFALVLGRQVHAVGLRTGSHERLEELAAHSAIPVINMLTERHHPCQALADLLTLRERFGRLDGLRLTYVGDGNNVARSLAVLGASAGLQVTVSSPAGYQLAGGGVHLVENPRAAVAEADAIYADVWLSMGDDEKAARERRTAFAPYRMDDDLLAAAPAHAVALHCLPAHPGEEISAEVLYGKRQAIWDQAENRRHAQKALLELLLSH